MTIKAEIQFRPFSHTPGTACLIPGTRSIIRAFPALLKIDHREIPLALKGPVREFTLQQDLERNCVFVFGRAKEGHFRLRIDAHDAGFKIRSEKGPLKDCEIAAETGFVLRPTLERLFLGSHKSQDWDQVQKRGDIRDWLPVLFCLGQKLPLIAPQPRLGTARLLELPTERKLLEEALESFFKAAFTHILVPRLSDDQHQGLAPEEEASGDPLFLIQEGAKMIRGLFFRQNERRLGLLPHLPISLDAGRMIGCQAAGIGAVDFEWSKKSLRRAVIRASTSGEVLLELQTEIKTFRVNKKRRQKSGEPLLLEAGKTVLLDQFQK